MRLPSTLLVLSLIFSGAAHAGPSLDDVARILKSRDYRIVHFAFNLDTLDAEARKKLDRQARFISRNRKIVFAVVGHTDKVGNRAYNEALGMRRAMRVVNYLVSRGVSRDQLHAMTSRGEDQPVVATLARERLNRRVETTVYRLAHHTAPATTTATVSSPTSPPPGNAPSQPPPTHTPVASPEPAPAPTPSPEPSPAPSPAPAPDPSTEPAPEPSPDPEPEPSLPGNKAAGIGRPDAGKGNGDEASGDPAGSVGHNKGGDEPTGS